VLQEINLGGFGLGCGGKETPRERFLRPPLLRDYAQLFVDLQNGQPG